MLPKLSPVPTLPKPFGPHKVGTSEWELPISEIPSQSPAPDDRLTTIKFRLYYPTEPNAKSRSSVTWLPAPQREWNAAYASFLGASSRVSSFISLIPFLLNLTTIPVVADAPLQSTETPSKRPLVVFSHGLGGNCHAYSAICTALASFGIVCAAPEHRDGSAPTALIRATDGHYTTRIPYQKHSHAPTEKVLNARNAQLRVRLWELEQLYAVLRGFNDGEAFTNYALAGTKTQPSPSLEGALDLQPGHITWAGHSFGACTMMQFVKSVYYHQSLPSLKDTEFENNLDWRPLLAATANEELVRQITAKSPMILLDLWAMPLKSGLTQWLWEKPLPCYDRKMEDAKPAPATNVLAIVSSEFYKWPELLNRMQAALSANPAEALRTLEKRTSAERPEGPKRTKSNSPVISTPADKVPPIVEEPESAAPANDSIEETHQPESEAGNDLYVTPFATGDIRDGETEFPFEQPLIDRRSSFDTWRHAIDDQSLRELRESSAATKAEADENILRKALESPVMKGKSESTSKTATPSQILSPPSMPTDSEVTPTPSAHQSRSPSPSPSVSTIDSTSTTSSSIPDHSDPNSIPLPDSSSTPLEDLSLPDSALPSHLNEPSNLDPHLYLIPQTAHLSQSDFGVLFPNLVRYLMKAENPVETIEMNVSAMLELMCGCGLWDGYEGDGGEKNRGMLTGGDVERWQRIDIY